MKRVIILVVMLFSLTTVMAQNDSIPDVSETERIIDKYGDKIINGFEKTVASVTPVAEEGFEMVVRLQVAKAYGEFIKGFISLLVILMIFRVQRLCYVKEEKGEWEEGAAIASYVFGAILQLIAVLYMAACIYDGVLLFVAPEWYAITEIMNLF